MKGIVVVTDVKNSMTTLEIAQAIAESVKTKQVPDVFAEDAVYVMPFHIPGTPDRVEGREAIMAMFANAGSSPASQAMDIQEVTPTFYPAADPNVITMEFVVDGKNKNTGEAFHFTSSIGVLKVADCKVKEWRDIPNMIGGADASGTIPQLVAVLNGLA
jgi:ketosteroid isomerase-like protein